MPRPIAEQRDRRQPFHAADHRRAERAEQQRRVEHLAELRRRRRRCAGTSRRTRGTRRAPTRRSAGGAPGCRAATRGRRPPPSARSATPIDVKRKNATSPSRMIGHDDQRQHVVAEERSCCRARCPTVKCRLMNGGYCTTSLLPSQCGSSSPSATRTCGDADRRDGEDQPRRAEEAAQEQRTRRARRARPRRRRPVAVAR